MRFGSAVFVGGAHVDLAGSLAAPPVAGASNPGRLVRRPGGAGLNTASVAAALGLATTVAGPVGEDPEAAALRRVLAERGIGDGLVAMAGAATGTFVSIVAPDGQMVIGLADLSINEAVAADWFLSRCRPALAADLWFLTANQQPATLMALAEAAEGRHVAAAAVSAAKAGRLAGCLARVDLLFANLGEARSLAGLPGADAGELACRLRDAGVGAGVISAAGAPLAFWQDGEVDSLAPPPLAAAIADVNGAGDALAGTVLAGLARGLTMARAVELGIAAAQLTLGVPEPVHPGLSWRLIEARAQIRPAVAPAGQTNAGKG